MQMESFVVRDFSPQNFLSKKETDLRWQLNEGHHFTGWVLPVVFDMKTFNLPLVTVNPRESEDRWISVNWLNSAIPELGLAVGRDVGRLAANLVTDGTVLMTFPSSKSQGMAVEALATSMQFSGKQDLDMVRIPGCKTEDLGRFFELQAGQIATVENMQIWHAMSDDGSKIGVNFLPVTGIRKSMWLGADELKRVNGKDIMGVDDVATTRATINAWELLLSQATSVDKVSIVTAAVEGEFQMGSNHRTLIRLPEILGSVDLAMSGLNN